MQIIPGAARALFLDCKLCSQAGTSGEHGLHARFVRLLRHRLQTGCLALGDSAEAVARAVSLALALAETGAAPLRHQKSASAVGSAFAP